MKKVLILTGSNNAPEQSINWRLASRAAANVTRSTVHVTGLHEHPLPMYQQALEADSLPEAVAAFGRVIREHDALVIVSPEHNGLMPACLKNAIDWLSRTRQEGESFFGKADKPVLLLSTSPGGNGGATNLKFMAELMPWWGGKVIGMHSVGGFHDKYQNGVFDAETESMLSDVMTHFESQF